MPEQQKPQMFNYEINYQAMTESERDIIAQADALAYDQAGCRMI